MLNNKIVEEDIEFVVNHDLPWEKFNNSTVLITGANGFLPAYMLETLLYLNDKHNKNINVIALVRNKEKTLKRFCHHNNRKDLIFLIQDVCEPIQLKKYENIDYIIHAASQASPKYYESDPIGTITPNTIGVMNLLKFSSEKNTKNFLYFSTGGVLGRINENNLPAKETDYGYLDPTDVKSCYNESKRMGESICVGWASLNDISIKIVRPSYVYGPGMQQNDGRVFPNFISNVASGKNIIVCGDGKKTRAFCYLADATLGFFTVLLKGKDSEVYNVGIEKETSILELANLLSRMYYDKGVKVIKKSMDKTTKDSQSTVQRSCLDISKIRQLGWTPIYDLKEGIERTIRSEGG